MVKIKFIENGVNIYTVIHGIIPKVGYGVDIKGQLYVVTSVIVSYVLDCVLVNVKLK